MADLHETARKEPTEPAGDVLMRAIARLLARQAARACLYEDPVADGQDRPEPAPRQSPDLE